MSRKEIIQELNRLAECSDNPGVFIVLNGLIAFMSMHEEDRLALYIQSFTSTFLLPKIKEDARLKMN